MEHDVRDSSIVFLNNWENNKFINGSKVLDLPVYNTIAIGCVCERTKYSQKWVSFILLLLARDFYFCF